MREKIACRATGYEAAGLATHSPTHTRAPKNDEGIGRSLLQR